MTTPIEALAYLSRQEPTYAHFQAFQAEVNAEKFDRGAAILLATNCETCLRYAIQRNLIVAADDVYQKIFRSGAPLGSFEAKIRIGFAMGIFREQTRNNLNAIKAIRNAFAHSIVPINFETPEVRAVCDLLIMPEIMWPRAISVATGNPTGNIPPDATTRVRFQKISEALSHNLFNFGTTISGGIPSDPTVGKSVKKVMPQPLP